MELRIREDGVPLIGDEDPVYTLEGGVSLLITPCIQATVKVHFLQRGVTKKIVELAHKSPV
jgi:hypothetical protein